MNVFQFQTAKFNNAKLQLFLLIMSCCLLLLRILSWRGSLSKAMDFHICEVSACMCAQLLQSRQPLCDCMYHCPPGSSLHGIIPA